MPRAPTRARPRPSGPASMATDAPSPDQDREDVLGPGDLARPEVRRSLDPELGHDARSPTEIPRRAWWVVVKRVAAETVSDHMTMNAASCAFYAMLALFPAISVLISLYGLI